MLSLVMGCAGDYSLRPCRQSSSDGMRLRTSCNEHSRKRICHLYGYCRHNRLSERVPPFQAELPLGGFSVSCGSCREELSTERPTVVSRALRLVQNPSCEGQALLALCLFPIGRACERERRPRRQHRDRGQRWGVFALSRYDRVASALCPSKWPGHIVPGPLFRRIAARAVTAAGPRPCRRLRP